MSDHTRNMKQGGSNTAASSDAASNSMIVDYATDERVPLEQSHLIRSSHFSELTDQGEEMEARAAFLRKYYEELTAQID